MLPCFFHPDLMNNARQLASPAPSPGWRRGGGAHRARVWDREGGTGARGVRPAWRERRRGTARGGRLARSQLPKAPQCRTQPLPEKPWADRSRRAGRGSRTQVGPCREGVGYRDGSAAPWGLGRVPDLAVASPARTSWLPRGFMSR